MKCLILGGAGFIGSHLADALLLLGHQVRIFDRPNLVRPESLCDDERIEWFEGDFLNLEDFAPAVIGVDIVFHLVSATLPKSSNENPLYDIETNLVGTLRLLELARQHSVKRIIFTSSGGTVYGVPKQLPISESHSTDPLVSYGISKLAIEKYLHLYHELHGIDYCVLRIANPYGERQRVSAAQGAVAVFLNRALHRQPIHIWGDGSVTRDYIYIQDVVDALVSSINYQGEQRVLNIGSGQGLSLNEILDAIEHLLGHFVARSYEPARNFDVPSNVLDISLAKAQLQWQPRTSFHDGLIKTHDWMLRVQHLQ
jgi:UDP-glucose 4-epimerase